jgi:hypothetical protein
MVILILSFPSWTGSIRAGTFSLRNKKEKKKKEKRFEDSLLLLSE